MSDNVSSAAVSSEIKQCTFCGLDREPQEMQNGSRCMLCNATRMRISRLGIDAVSYERFNSLAPIARHMFYKDNVDCLKAELKKKVYATIRLTVVDEETQGWVGTGDFLDEQEIRDKYPKNPLRAEMIIKNAKPFTCPISGVVLYEDMKFRSNVGHQGKRVREDITEIATEEEVNGEEKTQSESS